MPVRVALLIFLLTTTIQAADWRTYAGGFSSRWETTGPHGHDQEPCGYPTYEYLDDGRVVFMHGVNCNPDDFTRANLDNSIGFRLGRERDFLSLGPLRLVGGGEASVSHTEYNISQVDFTFMNLSALTGVDLEHAGFRAGYHFGGGGFATTDSRGGLQTWEEFAISVPIRAGASLRISRRESSSKRVMRGTGSRHADVLREKVPATETSLLFVATPGARATSHWDFSATSGTTRPGFGPTQNLALHTTAYHRLSAFRDFRSPRTQIEIAWTSTAHESKLLSDYRGYPGNQRGKTINGFGVGMFRTLAANERVSIRYGAGLEVADWRDPYPLLVWGNGHMLTAGIETAMTASGAIRYRLGRGLSIEANAQQLYWRDIHLGETRWGIGIALTH